NGEPEETRLWQWFRDESLKEFNRVYQMLGIEFDSFAGESFYSDKMERVVNMLKDAELLKESEGWHDRFVGVGLDSSEMGHPPLKFERLYKRCREMGFKLCMHAGEEGPPAYVREALIEIGVDRIDHGNRPMEDPALIQILKDTQTPLTNCPLSNLSLCVINDLKDSPVKAQLEAGLLVTVNSDDPAYFGGYIARNYEKTAEALGLSDAQLITLAHNSFTASFLPEAGKQKHLAAIDAAVA
ncbi:MAG: arginine--tRNA ligase, partial [Alphaproteobacteria bacterium]|nr:arginine--tRNA ligase [Alphaproteobacteria bacterium]